jgi:hypothetical protein
MTLAQRKNYCPYVQISIEVPARFRPKNPQSQSQKFHYSDLFASFSSQKISKFCPRNSNRYDVELQLKRLFGPHGQKAQRVDVFPYHQIMWRLPRCSPGNPDRVVTVVDRLLY